MEENNNIRTEDLKEQNNEIISKKRIIIAVSIIVIIFLGVVFFYNYPLTEKQKDEKIAETYLKEGYDEAIELAIKYYGQSDKTLGWIQAFSDVENKSVIEELTKVEQNLSKDGDYFDYYLTLKNESDKTITYIKYNIYLMDENNNIIHSDWSNWSGKLLPDAQVKMDTMIDYIPNVSSFSFEIEDVTVE